MKLQGKTAIVTGGAMGIGRAIAERLAADGANIVIADVKNCDTAAAEMNAKGFRASGAKVDVASEADTQAMAAEAVGAFGRIDILVNNAGIYSSLTPKPFDQISAAEWRKVMDVNTLGMFLCCRAVVGEMRRQKSGRIINIASGTPFKGLPYLLHYVSSKGAVVAFTRALAKELGGDNILVNGVAPGFTLSDGVMGNDVQLGKMRDIAVTTRTLARDMYPADIVGAVSFFASEDAAFITGQTLVVDGGSVFH